jgi:predicted GIY-YIG superfamily endonuclease
LKLKQQKEDELTKRKLAFEIAELKLNSKLEFDKKQIDERELSDLNILKIQYESDIKRITEENAKDPLGSLDILNQRLYALYLAYEANKKIINERTKKDIKALESKLIQDLLWLKTVYDIDVEAIDKEYEIKLITLLKKPKVPVKKELIITKTPFPKWWKNLITAPIIIATSGNHEIIRPTPKLLVFIATIVLTVSDETDLSFGFGIFPFSGAMSFGGTDEPRGIVIAMGDSPAPCGHSGFSIISSGVGVEVGGFVTYYTERETEQII